MAKESAPLMAVNDVSKIFGGYAALRNVSLSIEAGKVSELIERLWGREYGSR